MHKVILELCDNRYRYQFATIYILYAVCVQTSLNLWSEGLPENGTPVPKHVED
jgi:hypothetical protein